MQALIFIKIVTRTKYIKVAKLIAGFYKYMGLKNDEICSQLQIWKCFSSNLF